MEAVRQQALGAQTCAFAEARVGRERPAHRVRIMRLARPIRTEQMHGLPALPCADQQISVDDPVRHHPVALSQSVQHLIRSAISESPVIGHQPADV